MPWCSERERIRGCTVARAHIRGTGADRLAEALKRTSRVRWEVPVVFAWSEFHRQVDVEHLLV